MSKFLKIKEILVMNSIIFKIPMLKDEDTDGKSQHAEQTCFY